MSRFGETNENECKQKVVGHVCFFGLYALSLEKISCYLVGIFTNKDGNKSIILEAIVDQKLWIWHTYFGNNDLNILHRTSDLGFVGRCRCRPQFQGKW